MMQRGRGYLDVFGNAANKINKHGVPNKEIVTNFQIYVGSQILCANKSLFVKKIFMKKYQKE